MPRPTPQPTPHKGRRLGVASTHGWLWHQRAVGSFFVPTLSPYVLMAEGLRTARETPGKRINVKARACIFKGMLGVMFTVK
jgi:hypothetical protein